MTRMSILIHKYARPAMPLLKAVGMSTMPLYVAAEMLFHSTKPAACSPDWLSRRRAALFPRIIWTNRQCAGLGQQSECSIPRTTTHRSTKATHRSGSYPRSQNLALMAPLFPPPAVNLLDTSHCSPRSFLTTELSMTPGNDPEYALLYTVQRVQVVRRAQSSPGSAWAEGIGVASLDQSKCTT